MGSVRVIVPPTGIAVAAVNLKTNVPVFKVPAALSASVVSVKATVFVNLEPSSGVAAGVNDRSFLVASEYVPTICGPPVLTLLMPKTRPWVAPAATAAVVVQVMVSVVAAADPLFKRHVDCKPVLEPKLIDLVISMEAK